MLKRWPLSLTPPIQQNGQLSAALSLVSKEKTDV
ncbi:MAG: hypothetical protein ACJAWL_000028 [Motiliproteus sp.]|jgi:hypothetical protein